MLNKEFIAAMEQKLKEEKRQVEKKISELKELEEPKINPDIDEIAQDAEQDIINESLLNIYENLLNKINAALERIKQGNYGKCTRTGKEIERELLKKEPWVEFCRQ